MVMREVARTYDVKVEYQPSVANQQITGSLDLNKSLEVTLRQLEDASSRYHIHFNRNWKNTLLHPLSEPYIVHSH